MDREEILRMAREAWQLEFIPKSDVSKLERFAELVAAAERGVCAKVCDEMIVDTTQIIFNDHRIAIRIEAGNSIAKRLASKIRARGES